MHNVCANKYVLVRYGAFCFLKSKRRKRCMYLFISMHESVIYFKERWLLCNSTMPQCLGVLRAERWKLRINYAYYWTDVFEICPVKDPVVILLLKNLSGIKCEQLLVLNYCRKQVSYSVKLVKTETYLEGNRREENKIATKKLSTLLCLSKFYTSWSSQIGWIKRVEPFCFMIFSTKCRLKWRGKKDLRPNKNTQCRCTVRSYTISDSQRF